MEVGSMRRRTVATKGWAVVAVGSGEYERPMAHEFYFNRASAEKVAEAINRPGSVFCSGGRRIVVCPAVVRFEEPSL